MARERRKSGIKVGEKAFLYVSLCKLDQGLLTIRRDP